MAFSLILVISLPFKSTSPPVGRSSAARMFKSVVLPAPGFAHDGQVLAALDGKVYVGQGLHLGPAKTCGIGFFQVPDLKQ